MKTNDEVRTLVDSIPVLRLPADGKSKAATRKSNGEASKKQDGAHPIRILGFADFVKGYAPPVWLWERILRAGFLFALTALWGHAKTAVMLTVAVHVAAGRSIGGLRVERKRVLYLCGENPDDVRARVMAIARHFEIPAADLDGWIYFTERPFAIDSAAQLAAFAEDAVRLAPLGLVVVDTGPAHTMLDEENDNRQMHELSMAMRDMMGVLGYPCVVALMHPSKGATRDNMQPRGGGAFSGNVDAELCLWKDGELVELYHASKNRAGTFQPLFFRIEALELDGFADNFGRPPCTIVAVPIDEGTAEQAAQAQWRDENRVLWAMDMNPSGSISEWAEACTWVSQDGKPAKSKVHRLLKSLTKPGMVTQGRGGKWWLTTKGKDEAKRA